MEGQEETAERNRAIKELTHMHKQAVLGQFSQLFSQPGSKSLISTIDSVG